MSVLNKLVDDMIAEHKGGEAFFDNLDKNLQDKEYLMLLYTQAKSFNNNFVAITSGKFGLYFNKRMYSFVDCLNVNGGLRKGEKVISLEPFKADIEGKDFIFFDDSYYLGRTRNAVKAEIEKWGGNLIATFVCYDGSYEKDDSVHSLYRYYK